ncbi:MAG: zf-HC2 domain-containing protein [Candidatus Omnitrophica bacterium]|nr:zf-HC2 domain-containing protein [Candidatus Omnitrophota bacterium]
MQCKECRKLLSQFLDGQLEQGQQIAMKEHLKNCPECSRVLDSITEMVNLMHNIKEVSPPEDFAQKVNKKIDRTNVWQKFFSGLKIIFTPRIPAHVMAVAATVVIAVVIVRQWPIKETVYSGAALHEKAGPAVQISADTEKNKSADLVRTRQESLSKDQRSPFISKTLSASSVGYAEPKKEVEYCSGGVCEFPLEDTLRKKDESNLISLKEQISKKENKQLSNAVIETGADSGSKISEERTIIVLKPKNIKVELKPGNYIAANQKQVMSFEAVQKNNEALLIDNLLAELNIKDIVKVKSDERLKYSFTLPFGGFNKFLTKIKELGELKILTPMPVLRPEAYTSIYGGMIRPQILAEPIFVEVIIADKR